MTHHYFQQALGICRQVSRETFSHIYQPALLAIGLAVSLAIGVSSTAAFASSELEAKPATQQRSTTITENGVASTLSYPALQTATSDKHDTIPGKARQIAAHNDNFWVHEATLRLNQDYDHDGHYSSFSLTIDVDTFFSASTVYAVLYLSNNGYWNEYAVTGNFSIYGGSNSDRYTIDAVLDSGYPNGYYDHHIEIYDANSHTLLSHYGPENSNYFYGLPFESSYYDDEWTIDTSISLNFSGTGAIEYPTLLVVSLLLIRRRLLRVKQTRSGTPA